ncbi:MULTISPECIES: hypothetical protein [Methylobacterium]|jgi:hypothetical protein|uniref:hypothetical protein n=1 Tax=Methylobacterium TaxID=407 RepID=UPI0008DEE6A4|nr:MULTISPECIES: hypothetical protein [Methylobacterium]MBZ6412693.1 hypothetical protein [Methylobacterium sp.]MBK3396700.1 hypothetical protein [Methylobacterium ajmalii]MBK3407717.1 hypothetical protein [Methylobacterium ajmalii]MBK3422204.1 hypothetical protein [Methylobacterium ajmalii]SFF27864.1 hypothetical protein SAMN04487844_11389 [Methylobacterium sp. yr596]
MSTDVARACRRKQLASVASGLVAPGAGCAWQDWELACILARLLGTGPHTSEGVTPPYTTALEPARAFVRQALPGFYVVSGTCARTGHASIGPDYDGPDGERLAREWPPDGIAETGWHEELPHRDGPHRECRAILAAAVRALSHQNDRT